MDNRFLIFVCGCTGTGKSDLGIEIAKKFNGEIISADSMQIYKGLNIATNKVTKDEMQNIPHHLMSFYDPLNSKYNVHTFRNDTLLLLNQLWERKKLPIIVGGTLYYVESILYNNYLISSNTTKNDNLRARLLAENPTNDNLYDLLKKVDLKSAQQIHRHNMDRVLRALEIYYATGKCKSEHLSVQNQNVLNIGGNLRFPNTLLINLDAEKQILDERLNDRVHKMIKRGLQKELEDFYDEYGAVLDNKHGIMQSIGLKEFIFYLKLSKELRQSPIGEKNFLNGCELLKLHTRQYSKKQRNWLYHRILLRSNTRDVPYFVSLNTSQDFFEKVVPLSLKIIENFLNKKTLFNTVDSDYNSILMPLPKNANQIRDLFTSSDYQTKSNQIYNCTFCKKDIQSEKSWQAHITGRRHKKMVAAIKKRNQNINV